MASVFSETDRRLFLSHFSHWPLKFSSLFGGPYLRLSDPISFWWVTSVSGKIDHYFSHFWRRPQLSSLFSNFLQVLQVQIHHLFSGRYIKISTTSTFFEDSAFFGEQLQECGTSSRVKATTTNVGDQFLRQCVRIQKNDQENIIHFIFLGALISFFSSSFFSSLFGLGFLSFFFLS